MKKSILAFVLGAGLLTLGACNANKSSKAESAQEQEAVQVSEEQAKTEHAMLSVEGMCEMCKQRIETAAKSVNGVSSATWDLDKKELHLDFDPSATTLDAISKAVAKAGYDTDRDKAEPTDYDKLPDCCKYRG